MQILLVDQFESKFFPLCLTRPVGEMRTGILKSSEKWELLTGEKVTFLTRDSLNEKFPSKISGEFLAVDASIIPNFELIEALNGLKFGQSLQKDKVWIGSKMSSEIELSHWTQITRENAIEFKGDFIQIERLQDLFLKCHELIAFDYRLLTKGRASQSIHSSNTIIGPLENLFIEEGAKIFASIINVEEGPVYIGKNAMVMEGSLIRGPFALGHDSHLKMGAKVYGASSIGPHCKVGGEMSNSVFQGYSNKAHDGFIGNSVIGEWCNLGADTNTSNLKNNYSQVKIWNYDSQSYENSGLTFCGLMMGDHSKCSINTMFNTGTTIGVSVNIFGSGFPPKYVPSFSWGGSSGLSPYELSKAFDVAEKVMARRNVTFSEEDRDILSKIAEESGNF